MLVQSCSSFQDFTCLPHPCQHYVVATKHKTKGEIPQKMTKGHFNRLSKHVLKVTIRISYDIYIFLSRKDSSRSVAICHFRARDVSTFKSKSNDTGFRGMEASQGQIQHIRFALSCVAFLKTPLWQTTVLRKEIRVENAECFHNQYSQREQ